MKYTSTFIIRRLRAVYIIALLQKAHPEWSDERVLQQTARIMKGPDF